MALALSFQFLACAANFSNDQGYSNLVSIVLHFVAQSIADLLIGPVGYAMIGRIAPVKLQGILVMHTRDSLGFQYYAVLTLCRALYVLHHQEQTSKLKAGTWAKNQFPKWQELIQRALTKAGLTDANQALIEENYQEVTAFVDTIVQHIKKMGMSQ